MRQDDDRLPESVRNATRDYNNPPPLGQPDFDQMWSAIEQQAFPHRFASPSAEPNAPPRWFSTLTLLPLAAALLVGVAIGRFTTARKVATQAALLASRAPVDSVSVPNPYQGTASRYLGQAAALLASLPNEVHSSQANDRFLARAHDLLLTTRLLMDSPAATDPRFHALLEDLELVLAQIVRLQSDQSRTELDFIRQAVEQRDVLPRLRTAVADITVDN